MPKKVTTRFAPSPTGFLHVGSLRTALYNYLWAKKNKGKFLLRIEDTDQTRQVEGAAENMEKMLKIFNLSPDNNKPIIQSKRLNLYKKAADKLIVNNQAYYCFCSKDRLDKLRKDQQKKGVAPRYDGRCQNLSAQEIKSSLKTKKAVVRFKMPKTGSTEFTDLVRGKVKFDNKTLDDQVILKSDGFPTYHLASVVDDNEMKISHVIRGEEWLPSTPKHILLYQALGFTLPQFAHLPLLLNQDRSKLSKRQGDVAAEEFLTKGYLPQALLNFVLLLGWNPGTDQEIFSLQEMIEQFSLEKVNKAGAIFNTQKLDWLNGHYIRQSEPEKITDLAIPFLIQAGLIIPDFGTEEVNPDLTGYLGKQIVQKCKVATTKENISFGQMTRIIAIHQEKMKRLDEIASEVDYVFKDLKYDPRILIWKKTSPTDTAANLKKLNEFLSGIVEKKWTAKNLEKEIKAFIQKNKFGTGDILFPMRAALTGKKASPGPFAVAYILGKKKSLNRINQAVSLLEK